jgi:hypothetical protein
MLLRSCILRRPLLCHFHSAIAIATTFSFASCHLHRTWRGWSGVGRFRAAREDGASRSGEGFRISSLRRKYGCGERRKSSSDSTSEDVGASSRASGGSDSGDMSLYQCTSAPKTRLRRKLQILHFKKCISLVPHACSWKLRLLRSGAVGAIVELL